MKILFLSLIAFHSTITCIAQSDTSFTVVRKNAAAKFSFTKHNKSSPVQQYPLYTIEKSQIHRINMLLRSFVNNEAGCDLLVKNYDQLDSIFKMKELHYTEIIKTQELRSKNYEDAYQSLLVINAQLDQQLKNSRDLALAEHKRKRNNATLLGIVGGLSAGLIIGAILQ
jgi:hypothetical protein